MHSSAHDQASTEELFVFVHIPKTGGQTLRDCFIKHLEFHREFIHLGPFGRKSAAAAGLLPFEKRPELERRAARVILGHAVDCQTHTLVPSKIPRYIVFLRDPAELLVSLYNFDMHYRPPQTGVVPFAAWSGTARHANFMIHWLLRNFLKQPAEKILTRADFAKVQAALQDLWFVGCTEFLDRDAPALLQRIGIKATPERTNVAGIRYAKRLHLDDKLRQEIYEQSPLDLELYRWWQERLPESLTRITSP